MGSRLQCEHLQSIQLELQSGNCTTKELDASSAFFQDICNVMSQVLRLAATRYVLWLIVGQIEMTMVRSSNILG